jgi:hypothetical protein
VYILVTIHTEVFPVAPVGRIVMVISISVMDRQEMTVGVVKFPAAAGTDEAMNGKRSFTVIFTGSFFHALFQFPDHLFRRSRFFACLARNPGIHTLASTAERHSGHNTTSLQVSNGNIHPETVRHALTAFLHSIVF